MKLMILTALLTMSSFAAHAQNAGVFIEPGITYQDTETSVDWPILNDSTGKNKGAGAMLRLGMHASEIVFIGVDARYLQTRVSDSAFNTEADATGYNYGLAAGVQMPIVGLRLLGSYVLGGELDPKEDRGVDTKLKDPKGYRLGAGFQILMLSLNLEYQDMKYEKADITGVANNLDASVTDKGWIASVTFPMEF